jgi:hypothetical protein
VGGPVDVTDAMAFGWVASLSGHTGVQGDVGEIAEGEVGEVGESRGINGISGRTKVVLGDVSECRWGAKFLSFAGVDRTGRLRLRTRLKVRRKKALGVFGLAEVDVTDVRRQDSGLEEAGDEVANGSVLRNRGILFFNGVEVAAV